MLTPEEIIAHNRAKAQAVFERFDNQEPTKELEKSEKAAPYWTLEGLNKYKEDLFKGLDEGTLGSDDLSKAEEELLSLRKEIRFEGEKEITVFVKG